NSSYSKSNSVIQSNLPNDYIKGPYAFNWSSSSGSAKVDLDSRSASFSGGFSYNYKLKYVASFSFGTSASSSNVPERAWVKSPSFVLRWNFNREPFFEKLDWLSHGGLRLSWGKTVRPSGSIYDIYGKYNSGTNYNNRPTIGLEL